MMLDYTIVFSYLFITLILGLSTGKKITTLKEFSVSNKSYSDRVMVATLFSTVIGAGSTLGIVTNVYQYGLIFMFAFYGGAINKLLVGKYIAPRIGKFYDLFSMGDIFHKYYGQCGRRIAGVFICISCLACCGQQLSGIGFIFEQFLGIPFMVGVILAYSIVVIYSCVGGMRSIVITDVFQFLVMIAFIPIIFIAISHYFVDFQSIKDGIIFLRPTDVNPGKTIGKGITMFFVMTFSALGPTFTHRLIMCKSPEQAQYITRLTGYFTFPLVTLMGFLGLLAFIVNKNIDPNLALPYLIKHIMSPALSGLAVSALLAALMSTLDAALHVLGVSVIQDLFLVDSKTPEKTQIKYVRIATVILAFLSLTMALHFQNIFDIMVFSVSFWGPTVLIPFIFLLYGKVFQPRNLIVGSVIGVTTVILWHLLLEKNFKIDGYIPGMVVNLIYYIICLYQSQKTYLNAPSA